MLTARLKKHILKFIYPAGTSRGVLYHKPTWYIILEDGKYKGIGECSVIPGLSCDDYPDYESILQKIVSQINNTNSVEEIQLLDLPSIRFGLETALLDLNNNGNKLLFPGKFTIGIDALKINGLVWMGDPEFMNTQIEQKIQSGYTCIKLKIGAINFDEEVKLIENIRTRYGNADIEIRLDANGAFAPDEAMDKLMRLSFFDIHSIEQPIQTNQHDKLKWLCENSPIPVALDEELISIGSPVQKRKLLSFINPQYIVIKPGLLGGFQASTEWIEIANSLHIGWWITSALESNIGLNAIAQWTYMLNSNMVQGLGTGQLYSNNIPSPLEIEKGKLFYRPDQKWDLSLISI
ncbi:MAG: o-succinylbenzoate synthase [Bacteroidales bacterium]|nr:o-succinylbenzoate synthase [Bacteroidales bacterium]